MRPEACDFVSYLVLKTIDHAGGYNHGGQAERHRSYGYANDERREALRVAEGNFAHNK